MIERTRKPPNYSRRIFWLGVFVVLLVAGYSAGWFYLANLIETTTKATMASLKGEGVDADCADATARGYPFRIGLFCDRVTFADDRSGVRATAGAFRSAGQIYDPMRLMAELDGPATIAMPKIGDVTVDWTKLRASTRLAQPLPSRVSIEGGGLTAVRGDGAKLVEAKTFEGHMRSNEADLDLAFNFGGLALDPGLTDGHTLPPLSGDGDMTLTDGVRLVADNVKDLRGQSGVIRNLTLSVGGAGALSLSGPVSIDADGLVNAELKLALRDPASLSQALAASFPDQRGQIEQGFAGLAMLGNQPSLPLRIVKGKASLGFIPLGNVAPLAAMPE